MYKGRVFLAAVGFLGVVTAVNPPRTQAQGLTGRVSALEQQVADLIQQVAAQSQQIAGLTVQVAAHDQRIADLESTAQPLSLTVDCSAGETISGALAQAGSRPGHVDITILGICTESVFLSRSGVSLVGATPADGIQAPSSAEIVLDIHGARDVRLFQLTLSGGRFGIFATEGASFNATDITISGAAQDGIQVNQNSTGHIRNSTVHASQVNGVFADSGGHLLFDGGTIADTVQFAGAEASNGGTLDLRGVGIRNGGNLGVFAELGGSASISGSTIEANAIGVQVNQGGSAHLQNGTLIQNNGSSGVAVHGGQINVSGARIAGNPGVGIGLFNGARVELNDATIEGNGTGLLLLGGASVRTGPGTNVIQHNAGDGMSIGDTSVAELIDAATTLFVNNGGWGIFCAPAPAVAQIHGLPTVAGNEAGQVSCPGVVIP